MAGSRRSGSIAWRHYRLVERGMVDIATVGGFTSDRGADLACQIDIEAAVGLMQRVGHAPLMGHDTGKPHPQGETLARA